MPGGAAILRRKLVERLRQWRGEDWLRRATPTADAYFLNAMRPDVSPAGPIKPLGPNVFTCGGAHVILRYASAAELEALAALPRQKVYYVIDDDLAGIVEDTDLPSDYRRRIGDFVAHVLPRILDLEPTVLAPSQPILDSYPAHQGALLCPSLTRLRQQFGHFEAPARVDMVFTGTRTHLADFEVVAPAIEEMCASRPNVTFTTFLGRHLPRGLRALPNVASRQALPWPAYRAHLCGASYHIAIAPFRPTPSNQCRSHNKIHDHAALGAAGVYGDIAPYRASVTDGVDGLIAPSEPAAWLERLSALLDNLSAARELAENGARLSRDLGNPARLRAFWLARLDLSDG